MKRDLHRMFGMEGRHTIRRHRRRHGDEEWAAERMHRGGRRRVLDSEDLRLVLLSLIAEQPRHGYDLIRAVEAMTGGSYAPSPGVVYPALSVLQDMGQIEEAGSEAGRKAFAITEEGRTEIARSDDRLQALTSRLGALASMQERTDAAPVRRAMDNLRTALRQRLMAGEPDPELPHRIAEILDEATRRIERLNARS
ncbi:MAG: PadR family transcriptional regulator [Alphaproteobacteria bacterium]|nr:PadR family transcriptional regulator [Alphaproteobacteria bacterium]